MKIIQNQRLYSEFSTKHHYDVSFLELIKDSVPLKFFLGQIRKKLNLPSEGLPRNKQNLKKIFELNDHDFDQYTYGGIAFTKFFKLPPYWIQTGISLIVFDIASPPDRDYYDPIEIKLNKKGLFPEVSIVIREKTAIRNLKDFLAQNKDLYNELIAQLRKPPSIGFTNLRDKKEILNRVNMNKTYGQVIEDLDLNYTPDTLGKYARRAKKNLGKLDREYLRKGLAELLSIDSVFP